MILVNILKELGGNISVKILEVLNELIFLINLIGSVIKFVNYSKFFYL